MFVCLCVCVFMFVCVWLCVVVCVVVCVCENVCEHFRADVVCSGMCACVRVYCMWYNMRTCTCVKTKTFHAYYSKV